MALAAVFTRGAGLAGRPAVRRLTSADPTVTHAMSATDLLVIAHAGGGVHGATAGVSCPALVTNAVSTLTLPPASAQTAVVPWAVEVAAFTEATVVFLADVLALGADAEVVFTSAPAAADRSERLGTTVVIVCLTAVPAVGLRADTQPTHPAPTAATLRTVSLRGA